MKRTMILALLLCFTMAISAQNIPEISKEEKIVKVEYYTADKGVSPFVNNEVNLVSSKGMLSPNEVEIGETIYDLQSNAAINNRFWVWDDGTMAAVWTRGMEANGGPWRGTAYNYFDGVAWGPWPEVRLENVRCGWPNIAAWGAGEITVSHNGT